MCLKYFIILQLFHVALHAAPHLDFFQRNSATFFLLKQASQMLACTDTFAGCSPVNKAMAIRGNGVYYIAGSSIVHVPDRNIASIIFLKAPARCISSAGRFLAAGDKKGNGYKIEDARIIAVYEMNDAVQSCCITAEGWFVFATLDTLHVFNESISIKLTIDDLISSVGAIDRTIAVGTTTGRLYLYRIDQKESQNGIELVHATTAHEESISDIKFRDAYFFATASQDSTVKLWECQGSPVNIQTLSSHSDWVHALHWEGQDLYSASADKTIRLWQCDQSSQFYVSSQIFGGSSEFLGVIIKTFQPTDETIETFKSTDKTNDGQNGNTTDGEYTGEILKCVLAQCKTGGIDRYNLSNGMSHSHSNAASDSSPIISALPVLFSSGHTAEVTDADWCGNLLLTCGADSTARIFMEGRERARAQIHGYPISSISFLPGDTLRYASAAQETILRIYEATQLFFWNCDRPESSPESCVATAILSELNLTNENQTEYPREPLSENILSTNVFAEYRKIYGHYFEIRYVTSNGSVILSCNRSSSKKHAGLFVWNMDGELLQYVCDHDLGIQHISVTEKYALTVSRDKTACLYKLAGTELRLVKRDASNTRAVNCGAISGDNSVCATCSRDGRIILYDLSMNVLLERVLEEEPTSMCFSLLKKNIVVGFATGNLFVFDYKFNIIFREKVLNGRINSVIFNQAGDKLAVVGSDSLVRIMAYIDIN